MQGDVTVTQFQKYVKSIRLRPDDKPLRRKTEFQKYVKSIRLRPPVLDSDMDI